MNAFEWIIIIFGVVIFGGGLWLVLRPEPPHDDDWYESSGYVHRDWRNDEDKD